ncbi:hypothetical protein NL676_018796 [Syzygium grande]|nr:hypothetical protein NL676_018796 [Syzygium grande]
MISQLILTQPNLLHGDIPGSLAAISGLAELDLSFNSFSGLPPAFRFARLEFLAYVKSSNDVFWGTLRASGRSSSLTTPSELGIQQPDEPRVPLAQHLD